MLEIKRPFGQLKYIIWWHCLFPFNIIVKLICIIYNQIPRITLGLEMNFNWLMLSVLLTTFYSDFDVIHMVHSFVEGFALDWSTSKPTLVMRLLSSDWLAHFNEIFM